MESDVFGVDVIVLNRRELWWLGWWIAVSGEGGDLGWTDAGVGALGAGLVGGGGLASAAVGRSGSLQGTASSPAPCRAGS